MTAWLLTIEQEQVYEVGGTFELWTDPQRDSRTNDVRRRADGHPFTPAWDAPDGVVVYHPESERCVAILTVNGPPRWNEEKELFFIDTTVDGVDLADGPTLADIGVPKALQGGRHRLTPSQYAAARERLHPG